MTTIRSCRTNLMTMAIEKSRKRRPLQALSMTLRRSVSVSKSSFARRSLTICARSRSR